jgi:hypothetical protein
MVITAADAGDVAKATTQMASSGIALRILQDVGNGLSLLRFAENRSNLSPVQ